MAAHAQTTKANSVKFCEGSRICAENIAYRAAFDAYACVSRRQFVVGRADKNRIKDRKLWLRLLNISSDVKQLRRQLFRRMQLL